MGLDPASAHRKQTAFCPALQASLKHKYQQYSFPNDFFKNISWCPILPPFWRKHLPLKPPCSSQELMSQLTLASVLLLGFSFYPRLIAGPVRHPCNCIHNGQPTCRESHMQVSTSSESNRKNKKVYLEKLYY